jgi:uncharacterized repeat protein (TIGR03803 family)
MKARGVHVSLPAIFSRETWNLVVFVTTVTIMIMTSSHPVQAQTYTEEVLFNFVSSDGTGPLAGLVRNAKGNLYGTTSTNGPQPSGTVFKIDPSGNYTVLHAFTGGKDGGMPEANLYLDTQGNLFGTTTTGGTYSYGTVFEVTADGNETVLHSFGNGIDGKTPLAGLVRDAAGNFYGTTVTGGADGFGTVYRLSSDGQETLLYSFADGNDGAQPSGGLVLDTNNNLYGCAQFGGVAGGGTLFKLSQTGKYAVLHSFSDATGSFPTAAVRDKAGNFYGTTRSGGTHHDGTVFKVGATGIATVLHNFGAGTDGQYPYAGLITDTAGNFYGTTYGGGSSGLGTVYKIGPTGKETILYSFVKGGSKGDAAVGSLVMDSAGNLYGTTQYGGAGGGTLFAVSPQM